jgi:hypothetical protein
VNTKLKGQDQIVVLDERGYYQIYSFSNLIRAELQAILVRSIVIL